MSSSEQSTTLFRNVRVFDGRSPVLSNGSNVLVRGSTVESISTRSIDAGRSEHRVEIDGGGRVLMPGLIDAHWHAMLASMPIAAMMTADIGYLNLLAGEQATRTLHRGFTTVRDAGGPSFGLKRAIDDGTVAGPRIYPSGAFISQRPVTGLPHATRSATRDLWPPQSRRNHGCIDDRRWCRRSAAGSARAIDARGDADQDDGRRRCVVDHGRLMSRSTPRLSCAPACRRPRTGEPTS